MGQLSQKVASSPDLKASTLGTSFTKSMLDLLDANLLTRALSHEHMPGILVYDLADGGSVNTGLAQEDGNSTVGHARKVEAHVLASHRLGRGGEARPLDRVVPGPSMNHAQILIFASHGGDHVVEHGAEGLSEGKMERRLLEEGKVLLVAVKLLEDGQVADVHTLVVELVTDVGTDGAGVDQVGDAEEDEAGDQLLPGHTGGRPQMTRTMPVDQDHGAMLTLDDDEVPGSAMASQLGKIDLTRRNAPDRDLGADVVVSHDVGDVLWRERVVGTSGTSSQSDDRPVERTIHHTNFVVGHDKDLLEDFFGGGRNE